MYPENPEGTQVIVGSMNMGYISDTARNQTHNLFRPKREPIPLGHSDGFEWPYANAVVRDVPDPCFYRILDFTGSLIRIRNRISEPDSGSGF